MSVDGVQRVVCGITEETTCQDVVVVLAQALGQPGRYTLRETFKEFQRCMTPEERLLETLGKYGEQAREVQLSLHHVGPSACDEMSRSKVGRYQPCPPLRRKDAGTRTRRGSGSISSHRRSLPPLSTLRQEAEQQQQQRDHKKPKRKSLTLMEEAWEWLESLGKSKVYSTAGEKDASKKADKRNRTSLDIFLSVDKDISAREARGKARGPRGQRSDLDHQTSCCMGTQSRGKESKHYRKNDEVKLDLIEARCMEDEKIGLRETIVCQLGLLQDLQSQVARVDKQIAELVEKQRVRSAEQEARLRAAEEETEQIKFWENELKAEEGFEKDLQRQFLELKAKASECKPRLEGYRRRLQGLDFAAAHEEPREASTCGATTAAAPKAMAEGGERLQSDPDGTVNVNRKFQPREEPHALVAPCQMKERRPTGPTELREWWTRWSEAQSNQSQKNNKKKAIHRSELTIYLGSGKV